MPKNKPHNGLRKRIRITGTGKIKMARSGGRHKRSHKSGKLLRSYRQPKYAVPAEAKRAAAMLHIPARPPRTAETESTGEGSSE